MLPPWNTYGLVTLNPHSIQTVLIQAHEKETLVHRVLRLILYLVSMPTSCNLTVVIIKDSTFFTSEAAECEPSMARSKVPCPTQKSKAVLPEKLCGSIPVFPTCERHEDHGFKVILGYVRLCLKEKLPVTLIYSKV